MLWMMYFVLQFAVESFVLINKRMTKHWRTWRTLQFNAHDLFTLSACLVKISGKLSASFPLFSTYIFPGLTWHVRMRVICSPLDRRSFASCLQVLNNRSSRLSVSRSIARASPQFFFPTFCILFVSFFCKFHDSANSWTVYLFRLSFCHVFVVRSFSSRVPLIAPAWLRTPNTTNCTLDPKLRLSQTNDVIFVWRQQDNGYKINSYVYMQLLCIVLCILRSHSDMIDHINCEIWFWF